MAKSTNDKRLESVQKSITLHRRQLNTLLFRIEDLEAAMDDAKQRQDRIQELQKRRRAG